MVDCTLLYKKILILFDCSSLSFSSIQFNSIRMTLFPSFSTLSTSFDPHGARKNVASSNYWINSSSIEDKASQLTKEAEAELKKAGQAVKTKVRTPIELYSTEFYLTCGFGGVFGKSSFPYEFTF